MFVGSPLYFEGLSGLKKPLYAIELFINKRRTFKEEKPMALINLNIKSFKKNGGGIANRLLDKAVNKLEQKLENTVEDLIGKGLSKIGLSSSGVSNFVSRFGDAKANGAEDDFFRDSKAEQNRLAPRYIVENMTAKTGGESASDATKNISTGGAANREKFYQFPERLGEYYMLMRFKQYKRPNPHYNAELVPYDTFAVPIPREIKEQFGINVKSSAQGFAGGLADVGFTAAGGNGARANSQLDALLYNAAVTKIGELSAQGGEILGQLAGAIPNPHMQAIFEGVELRNHSFQWTFTPRNAAESRSLRAMIDLFKQNCLPAFSKLGTPVLQYPPLVDIEFVPSEIRDLIKFNTCMVKDVSINYAPQGLPSFFHGTKQPTMIQLSIELIETEIQTANKYGVGAGTPEREDGATKIVEMVDSGSDRLPGVAEAKRLVETGVSGVMSAFAEGAAGANNR